MDLRGINNFFGDMDLFLLDLILKGKIPDQGRVLDVGCGDGRNGIYFIKNGYEYHGWDIDNSKISMLSYLAESLDSSQTHFKKIDLLDAPTVLFDFIICSRMLHFSESENHFKKQWNRLKELLVSGGILYVSMDSAIDNTLAIPRENGTFEFPDSKVRFALTVELYEGMKKGFEELEPLKTVAHHNERAQSFLILQRV